MSREKWSDKSDELLFGSVGEQPGSQASYERDVEIRRRLYDLQRQSIKAQTEAIEEQRRATEAQRVAIDEMRTQSRIMFASVVGIFLTAVVTLVAALVS